MSNPPSAACFEMPPKKPRAVDEAEVAKLSTEQLLEHAFLQKALMDAAVDGIIAIDQSGRITMFNSGAESLFGYTRAEALGQNVSLLMPAPHRQHHDGYMQDYLAGGAPRIIGTGRDVTGQHKTGRTFPMHLSIGEAKTASGSQFIGVCHDLSNYQTALRQLAQTEKRYRDIVQNQAELICRLDNQLRISFLNDAFCELLQQPDVLLMGHSCVDIVHPDDRQLFRRQLAGAPARGGKAHPFRTRVRSSDGRACWIEWRFHKATTGADEPLEYQGFGIDISPQVAAQNEARFFAAHDALTGLLNQAAFIERCELSLAAAHAEGTACAALFIDFYRFKWINESLGHAAGDTVLRTVAHRLRDHLPASAAICRWGSDEFAILLSTTGNRDLALRAAKQLQQLLTQPYEVQGTVLDRGVSIGVSMFPVDGGEPTELIRKAETAMLAGKRRERGLISFYSEQSHTGTHRSLLMEQGIKTALQQEQFYLAFQPKVDLETQAVTGFEALLRWHHPSWGAVSPGEFIPFAEEHGLASQIDEWVFTAVCNQLRLWQSHGLNPLPIAVNLSAVNFRSATLVERLLTITHAHGVTPELIELEITEGVAMEDTQKVVAAVHGLRAAGFAIAIDDFGTGYSSLQYLSQLPVTCLKIDQAFISGLNQSKSHRTVVDTVIALARALQLQVIAEGVETHAQADYLLARGCPTAQGFLYYRPLGADSAAALLAQTVTVVSP